MGILRRRGAKTNMVEKKKRSKYGTSLKESGRDPSITMIDGLLRAVFSVLRFIFQTFLCSS